MISLGASAEVYSGPCGDNAKWSFDTTTGLLSITGSGSMTDYNFYFNAPWYDYRNYIVTASIEDQITSIGNYVFYDCSSLTSVTIPNSVISIGSSAFEYCSGLTSVTIPNSVTSIGSSAFNDCSGLTSVTIPNSVTSIDSYAFSGCNNVKELIYAEGTKIVLRTYLTSITSVTIPNSATSIEDWAFSSNRSLTSVTIPNSVISIGSSAFIGCSGLTSVIIGKSVTTIKRDAFEDCSGLTSVAIPNSVTWIGEDAFRSCSGLTSITIPNSVKSIGNDAFSLCYIQRDKFINNSSLTSNNYWGAVILDERTDDGLCIKDNCVIKYFGNGSSVTIGNSVTSIGNQAFFECSGLASVIIGNSVTSIGNYAFYGCSGLTSMTIPNAVTSIGNWAFDRCSGLSSVAIGNSVTSIGDGAFYECLSLTSVKVDLKSPLTINANVWERVDIRKCVLYVPEGTKSIYRSAPVWEDFVNIEEFSDEPEEDVYLTIKCITGTIIKQCVKTGETYKYQLNNDKNGKIVTVTFNGEDVTSDVTNGKYTTPKITGNSEIYVEYDNQPLGDVNLDGSVNVNDITKTAEIILLRAKAEMEAKAAMEEIAEP